jgi:hypothetical protein
MSAELARRTGHSHPVNGQRFIHEREPVQAPARPRQLRTLSRAKRVRRGNRVPKLPASRAQFDGSSHLSSMRRAETAGTAETPPRACRAGNWSERSIPPQVCQKLAAWRTGVRLAHVGGLSTVVRCRACSRGRSRWRTAWSHMVDHLLEHDAVRGGVAVTWPNACRCDQAHARLHPCLTRR